MGLSGMKIFWRAPNKRCGAACRVAIARLGGERSAFGGLEGHRLKTVVARAAVPEIDGAALFFFDPLRGRNRLAALSAGILLGQIAKTGSSHGRFSLRGVSCCKQMDSGAAGTAARSSESLGAKPPCAYTLARRGSTAASSHRPRLARVRRACSSSRRNTFPVPPAIDGKQVKATAPRAQATGRAIAAAASTRAARPAHA